MVSTKTATDKFADHPMGWVPRSILESIAKHAPRAESKNHSSYKKVHHEIKNNSDAGIQFDDSDNACTKH
jgi:hypothetical protein